MVRHRARTLFGVVCFGRLQECTSKGIVDRHWHRVIQVPIGQTKSNHQQPRSTQLYPYHLVLVIQKQ